MSENFAGVLRFTFRFVSRTFSVVNESFLMFLDSSMEERCRSGLTRQPAEEKVRCSRYGSALFFSHTVFLGTNTFV